MPHPLGATADQRRIATIRQERPSAGNSERNGRSQNGVVFGLTRSSPMNAPTSLDETIRRAQDILWSALPPGVARTSAVVELKELLWSTQTREALALQRQLSGVRVARKPYGARRRVRVAGQDLVGVMDDSRRSRAQRCARHSPRFLRERCQAGSSVALTAVEKPLPFA